MSTIKFKRLFEIMPYGKDVFVLPHLGEGSKRGDNNDHGDNAGSETESLGCSEHVQHEPRQRDRILPPFEIENGGCPESASLVRGSASIRGRQQQQQQRPVGRPSRKLLLARPSPFEPITDPFAFVCEVARRPKFGHQYVLCPGRRKRGDHIGYSVGPHWAGVIYTISMIGVITIFLVRFIVNDVAAWCQPVTVACSLVTVGFLVATAVADPGIVVESAEEGEACAYCEECDIWRPDGAEHCEEW